MAETWVDIEDKRGVIGVIVDDELDGIKNNDIYEI